jgi:hypothetical protein
MANTDGVDEKLVSFYIVRHMELYSMSSAESLSLQ